MKFIPIPENEADNSIEFEDKYEKCDIPFDPMVKDFHKNSSLREAFAQYFEPWKIKSLYEILHNMMPEGKFEQAKLEHSSDKNRYSRINKFDGNLLMKIRISLDYPLYERWISDVEIKANRFGDIFGIAYDMYEYIYSLDDNYWREIGFQDKAPSIGLMNKIYAEENNEKENNTYLVNRASGKYVWGHVIEDLAFELLKFRPVKNWPITKERRKVVVEVEDVEESEIMDGDFDDDEEIDEDLLINEVGEVEIEEEEGLEPLSKEKYGDCVPFIGEVSFFIGS